MAAAKKVIFVTGSNYSGTIMLSKMLSMLEGALFTGEMQHCRSPKELVCLSCGIDCPLWKGFECHFGESAHELIAEKSGKSIIIDSTNWPVSWMAEQSELLTKQEIPWVLILITRDPRAVIAKRWKMKPHTTVVEHANEWRRKTGGREKLFRNLASSGTVIRIPYEKLVREPEKTLRTICENIKLPFDERLLNPEKENQHRLIGRADINKLTDESIPTPTKLNEEWEKELDEGTKRLIEETAGELLPLYTWEP